MTDPSRAAAIVIRRAVAADARGIATVQVLTWRATYRGIVDDAYIDGLTIEAREARWRTMLDTPPERAHDIFVAETRAEGVIGFASGGALREPALSAECDAELYAIYILPESQRRGLGRTLVRAVARALL
ncbi:MAG: GNAT family N-acetyltransferase, partial [Candidatus Eremiobacteraeota bacterium]|nr:GNAT family N-acetyltransferase [Candidatus Eremiobacteraeota bacterium]